MNVQGVLALLFVIVTVNSVTLFVLTRWVRLLSVRTALAPRPAVSSPVCNRPDEALEAYLAAKFGLTPPSDDDVSGPESSDQVVDRLPGSDEVALLPVDRVTSGTALNSERHIPGFAVTDVGDHDGRETVKVGQPFDLPRSGLLTGIPRPPADRVDQRNDREGERDPSGEPNPPVHAADRTDAFDKALTVEVRAELVKQRRTVTELAAVLGITRPTLHSRLAGKSSFDVVEMAIAARWFGIAPDALVRRAELRVSQDAA